ncbi:MAG TPA: hypothetical protein PKB14_11105 [Rubrivivax sp.]|nr:hypothetical protein [Rubrivivax sp.]
MNASIERGHIVEVQRRIIDVSGTRVVLELPASFVNRRVEVIALTVDDDTVSPEPRSVRRPSPLIAGKGRTLGDIVGPVVDPSDWAETK